MDSWESPKGGWTLPMNAFHRGTIAKNMKTPQTVNSAGNTALFKSVAPCTVYHPLGKPNSEAVDRPAYLLSIAERLHLGIVDERMERHRKPSIQTEAYGARTPAVRLVAETDCLLSTSDNFVSTTCPDTQRKAVECRYVRCIGLA